jgi:hypothetical protein
MHTTMAWIPLPLNKLRPSFSPTPPSQKVEICFNDEPDPFNDDTSSILSDNLIQASLPDLSEGEVELLPVGEKETLPSVLRSP